MRSARITECRVKLSSHDTDPGLAHQLGRSGTATGTHTDDDHLDVLEWTQGRPRVYLVRGREDLLLCLFSGDKLFQLLDQQPYRPAHNRQARAYRGEVRLDQLLLERKQPVLAHRIQLCN